MIYVMSLKMYHKLRYDEWGNSVLTHKGLVDYLNSGVFGIRGKITEVRVNK